MNDDRCTEFLRGCEAVLDRAVGALTKISCEKYLAQHDVVALLLIGRPSLSTRAPEEKLLAAKVLLVERLERFGRLSVAAGSFLASGIRTTTVAYRSPWAVLGVPPGRPLPARRSFAFVCVGWNLDVNGLVERWDFDVGPKHRLLDRDRNFEMQIASVALKEGMRFDSDGNEQVARWPLLRPGMPLPRKRIFWPSSIPAGIFTLRCAGEGRRHRISLGAEVRP